MATPQRLQGLDALKGLACVLIVWHHLAFYGPMSDVVYSSAPGLMDWLYGYARMAVQFFLVAGGFLAAASLVPQGTAVFEAPGALMLRRYGRLVKPYLVALAVSVLVAALVRPWFDHPSVPAAPTLFQLLAHGLLLQDVLGQEALSAGVWYVAMDFQLYAMTVLVFTAARPLRGSTAVSAGPMAVLLIALLSLAVFNRACPLTSAPCIFSVLCARHAGLLGLARSGCAPRVLAGRHRCAGRAGPGAGFQGPACGGPGHRLRPGVAGRPCARPLAAARAAAAPAPATGAHLLLGVPDPLPGLPAGQCARQPFLADAVGAANGVGMLLAFALSLLAGQALYQWVESAPALFAPGRFRRLFSR
jgi:hypothetical protein